MLLSWQQANLIAFGTNAFITYSVGSTDRIFGKYGFKDNKQISEQYPTLVTPAGWAFIIWAPIFLLEGGSMVYQFYRVDPALIAASPYWCLGCVLQSAWTIAFASDRIALSSVLITLLTGAIGCTYNAARMIEAPDPMTYTLCILPFAMHTAWLVAASLVNFNVTAVKLRASPQIQPQLAWASQVLAGAGSGALALIYNEPTFALVGAWALTAIARFQAPESLTKTIPPRSYQALKQFAERGAGCLGVIGICLMARQMIRK